MNSQSMMGIVHITGITSTKGLILLNELTYWIRCAEFIINPMNADEFRLDINSFYDKYHIDFKDIGKSRF